MNDEARPWAGRRLHFIGVGGAGMSGYARAAAALGADVSGSDQATSALSECLRADGVLEASVGHAAVNIPSGSGVEVVYSSAVGAENPERLAARERGLLERPRSQLLSEFSALRRTIAVAGAHGKTTTASMIVSALLAARMDPGWLVGSSVGAGRPNAHWGQGEWLVVEADESDRSMLALNVEIAVLTNVELDHHTAFASVSELREAFRAFLAGAARAVIWDRSELLALRDGPVLAYDAPDAVLSAGGSLLRWRGREVILSVPGTHNAVNAVAALEAACLAGADPALAAEGLERFTGSARRFSRLGHSARGALLIDDYAHHPTELAATLRGARTLAHDRLVAVFQPHLYSRTAALSDAFGDSLALADAVWVLDVYPARERATDFPGVSGLRVARAAADAARGAPVYWMPSALDARAALVADLGPGDVCVIMGAGDVDVLGRSLVADEDEGCSRP